MARDLGPAGFFHRTVLENVATARAVVDLRERHLVLLSAQGRATGNLLRLLEILFVHPAVTVRYIQERLGVLYPAADSLVQRMVDLQLLEEATGQRRNRRFRYRSYLDLFEG